MLGVVGRAAAGRAGLCVRAMTTVAAPEVLLRPPVLPEKLLLGPGPSNVPKEINDTFQLPMQGYLHPEFLQLMQDTKAGIQYLFQTRNPVTLAVSGTGHAGMEAALANLAEPGESVLIAEHGLWGQRAAEIASRHGATVHVIQKPAGEAFSLTEIQQAIQKHKPVVFFLCHGESSTGVLHSLEGVAEACAKEGCLLLVDTVASLAATPFFADQWGVDCVYSATQKALSCPPGLAPITFSSKAWTKITNRKTKPRTFYLDMKMVANYWGCDEEAPRYHHTAPISLVYALREAIARVAKEGLEQSVQRHQDNALRLHEGLHQLGLSLFVKDPKCRLPTLTTVCVPEGVDWKAVVQYLMDKHKIEIAGGLGPTVGKIWRIGLMGYNNNPESVSRVLTALKEALDREGYKA